MNIELKRVTNNQKDLNTIMHMMFNEPGIKDIFSGKKTRLLFSPLTYIIEVDSKDIGFFNLVDEQVEGIFFVDLGIIKEYRGKGIAKEVLSTIPSIKCSNFIVSEVKKDNIPANKVSSQIGVMVTETEDRNFYLMQKERLEEFIDSNGLEKLSKKFQTKKQLS